MIYFCDSDDDWHCGLLHAEGPACTGRWQIYVGALLERDAALPFVRLCIEQAKS